MCNFFSFISDPDKPIPERFMSMDWPTRKKILAGKLTYTADSHTSIADFHGYKGEAEDKLNKYEYNPLLGKFAVDQINHQTDDRAEAEAWVRNLDFKKVIAPLIIKPIIYPFKIPPPKTTPEVLELLKQWNSVWASVGASARGSVWASVRDSVWDSVWVSVGDSVWASVGVSVGGSVGASVWDSVWDSVGAIVRDSVWASVGASVRDSVWASVGASVWAYVASFFKIKYEHDFSSAAKLWEMGLVPIHNGTTWRLYGAEKPTILWEGEI